MSFDIFVRNYFKKFSLGPVPEYACPLYFGGRQAPCLGGVLALDGRNGSILWRHWAAHLVSNIDCEIDLTGDKIRDCLSSGDNGVLYITFYIYLYIYRNV